MSAGDIILVLLLAGTFLLGFFQGVTRSLLLVFAWLVAFLLAANLWHPVGDYIARQWANLDAAYSHMVAFGVVTLAVFGLLTAFIVFSARTPRGLTSYPLLDDLMGGLVGVLFALVVIATASIALVTVYGPLEPGVFYRDLDWSAQAHRALSDSALGRLIDDTVVRLMGTVLGPLVPQVLREAMV